MAGQVSLGRVSLINNGGASIQLRARFGMAWTKDRFPATHHLRVRVDGGADVAFAAMVGRNTWANGSFRSTADGGIVIHDTTPLAAGASRTYEVYAVAGTQGTSSFDPWAWIAAHAKDFTVEITARTGSSTGAMSNLTFGMKAAIAEATRREIVSNTPRFVRTKVWQKLSGEEHLICEFHHDFWLDASGNVVAVEWTPVLTQHWWIANPFGVSQPKQRQDYTATIKYGATTLDTRTVQHAYHCRWASLRSDNDPQHARKHWINISNAPLPTIRVKYELATLREMMRTGIMPPIAQDTRPLRTPVARTYAPLETNGHNAGISGTGAYPGRGVWCEFASTVLRHQRGGAGTNPDAAWREARVAAQGGLSYYGHHFDHRPVDGAVRNRIMPCPFRKISSSAQVYPGLGSPVAHSRGNSSADAAIGALPWMSWDNVHGGTGAFSGADAAHAVNYSGPMAFLEGEKYLGDAAWGALTWNMTGQAFNIYTADRILYYAGSPRGNAWGIPTGEGAANRYGTVIAMYAQNRATAWSVNLLNATYLITDDRDPAFPYLINVAVASEKLLSDFFAYVPPSFRAVGGGAHTQAEWHYPIWQYAMRVFTCYHAHRHMSDRLPINPRGFNGFEEMAFLDARLIRKLLSSAGFYSPATSDIYVTADLQGVERFIDPEWVPIYVSVTLNNSVFTWTTGSPGLIRATNGDRVMISARDGSHTPKTPPPELSLNTFYYIVNANGASFQLAATPGGAPLTITGSGSYGMHMTPSSYKQTVAGGGGGTMPDTIGYFALHYAAGEMAIAQGHSDFDSAFVAEWDTFFGPFRTNPSGDISSLHQYDRTLLEAS